MGISSLIFENVTVKYTSSINQFFFGQCYARCQYKNEGCNHVLLFPILFSSWLFLFFPSISFADVIMELIGRKKPCLLALLQSNGCKFR